MTPRAAASPTRRLARRLAGLACALAAALPVAPAAAQEGDFLLLGPDGTRRAVTVTQLRDVLVLEDGRVPLDECLALLRAAPDGTLAASASRVVLPAGFGIVLLADGQRMPGRLLPRDDASAGGLDGTLDEDAVAWLHPWLGAVALPLESIRTIVLQPAESPARLAAATGDRVRLRNGDVLEGFLLAAGATVEIETGVDDASGAGRDVVTVPIDRVAAIELVTEPRRPEGARAWFSDGTVIAVDALVARADGYLELRTPWADEVPPDGVLQGDLLALVPDASRLVPLARLEVEASRALGPRHFVPAPRDRQPTAAAGLGSLELRGPCAATWTLPDGAERFAAEVRLAPGTLPWGDCVLVVASAGEVLARVELSAASPTARVNVALPTAELELRVERGRHGPVQDVVRLDQPRVVVRP